MTAPRTLLALVMFALTTGCAANPRPKGVLPMHAPFIPPTPVSILEHAEPSKDFSSVQSFESSSPSSAAAHVDHIPAARLQEIQQCWRCQ